MQNQTIRFRQNVVGKVFPDKFTKMRMEDFVSKAIDNKNILNKREFEALISVRGEMSKGNIVCKEFIAKKHKDKIELVGFE